MIRWADRPPADDSLPHLPLIRVPARGSIAGALTTPHILQVWTHYISRRTQPCTTDACPGCEAQLPKRYEAYASIWTTTPSRHIIVALTPGAAEGLLSSAPNPQDLLGLRVTIQRLGSRANGRLVCRVDGDQVHSSKLPPIPELAAHMFKIWGIDQSHTAQDHAGYADEVRNQFNPQERPRGS